MTLNPKHLRKSQKSLDFTALNLWLQLLSFSQIKLKEQLVESIGFLSSAQTIIVRKLFSSKPEVAINEKHFLLLRFIDILRHPQLLDRLRVRRLKKLIYNV